MVVNLKLCRFEDAPWGFRLIGGSDFEVPLTVVKVTEGSIADKAGMRVGDVVVRINDTPTSDLTHNDAHKVILHCGNNFFLGVLRENDDESNEELNLQGNETTFKPISDLNTNDVSQCQDSNENITCDIDVENLKNGEVQQEEKVTDDEIAEIMSGEAEVLKEHNVIGVNFHRIFPKAGVCQSSEVFRHLNEEATKTVAEKEKDKRKWTTFLQKPDRPIPKSKKELELEELNREKYRVQIVKQPKPRVAPDHIPTPSPEIPPDPEPEFDLIANSVELQPTEEVAQFEIDTVVQNDFSDGDATQGSTESTTEDILVPKDAEPPSDDIVNDLCQSLESEQEVEIAKPNEVCEQTEEEILLQKQLSDVQQQLLALSTLPSTIQATLDAVTKQLADLLPAFHLQSPIKEKEPSPVAHVCELIEESRPAETEEIENQEATIACEETIEPVQQEQLEIEIPSRNESNELSIEAKSVPEVMEDEEHCQSTITEDIEIRKKKAQLDEEHQQRLIRERTPRRPPRAFGPLTPQERPLILPGGRRWRKPKDAFNEEFIAEILSSQAELIVGTTLGSTFESPLLGYDERALNFDLLLPKENNRVNFLKYQKPEKHIDLEKSEVYKIIHNLEKKPKRGIASRPEKVLAEADVRSRATPLSSG